MDDRPGNQWITLRGKFGENETIKIEATMFDGSVVVQKSGDDSTAEDVRLHISLLVDVSKGENVIWSLSALHGRIILRFRKFTSIGVMALQNGLTWDLILGILIRSFRMHFLTS